MPPTSPLWTSADAALATQGSPQGESWQATGVSIDSRSLKPGALFVALKGPSFDGHNYVHAAAENGAAAAIVDTPQPIDIPQLVVPDTQCALEDLARTARERMAGRVIGVTGSVGKTTLRAMLANALEVSGRVHATSGNLNNHIGLPLTLANMPATTDYAVLEMGMNHAGEITALSRLARPHLAVITTVDAVHLEHFASVADIARAKAEIVTGLEPGGRLIFPTDNPHAALLQEAAREREIDTLGFGRDPSSAIRLLKTAYEEEAVRVTALLPEDRRLTYRLRMNGEEAVMNSLAALAALHALGEGTARGMEALAEMDYLPGRGQCAAVTWRGRCFRLIDDSYNASPASMRAALARLGRMPMLPGGKKIVLLGDMLELGEDAPALHAALAEPVVTTGAQAVLTAGELMTSLHDALPESLIRHHCDGPLACLPLLENMLQNGDLLLCKGSHGSGIHKIVATLKYALPEGSV